MARRSLPEKAITLSSQKHFGLRALCQGFTPLFCPVHRDGEDASPLCVFLDPWDQNELGLRCLVADGFDRCVLL
jgi:hypothetical protein